MQLTLGDPFLRDGTFGDVDESAEADAAMRAAWDSVRSELLDGWITDNPGTRPFAWWRYDAPEPRQRIDGKPHPFGDPSRLAVVANLRATNDADDWLCRAACRLSFGTPTLAGLGEGFASYETQAAYLERLGLLTDGERAAMSAATAPPGLKGTSVSCLAVERYHDGPRPRHTHSRTNNGTTRQCATISATF